MNTLGSILVAISASFALGESKVCSQATDLWVARFVSAQAEDLLFTPNNHQVIRCFPNDRGDFAGPDHLVENGVLYLRTQVTRSAGLYVKVLRRDWNEAALASYLARFPGLKELLPAPSRPNGGIKWLGETAPATSPARDDD